MLHLQSSLLNLSHLRHGFFGRGGGVSTGDYESLNCGLGSKDASENVRENRRRVMASLGIESTSVTTPYQIHSAKVAYLERALEPHERPQVDAFVTDKPNIALGILTADCGTILFADTQKPVIGAAHAGWRGAIGGILENTVTEMEKLGSERRNIVAALGPTITQDSYEFGPEAPTLFPTQFLKGLPTGKFLFDLPGLIKQRLTDLNLKATEHFSRDTYTDPAFFSYRRAMQAKRPEAGRHIGVISLVSNP